jgi:uncharacterized membrane protein YhhN
MIWIPVATLVASGLLLLRAERCVPRNVAQVKLWKPLATLSCIAVCALSFAQPRVDASYTALILLGLGWSLVGDVLLIPQDDAKAFLAGLVAFLFAHIAYIAAFVHLQSTIGQPPNAPGELVTAVVLAGVVLIFYRLMRPGLGKLRGPVIAYMLVISIMVHRALAFAWIHTGPPAAPALVVFGAVLFYVSDAVLGLNKFRFDGRMPHYKWLNLSTYYAGQFLLALSASFVA